MSFLFRSMEPPETPAFIYDEMKLMRSCEQVRNAAQISGCKFIFALKSCAISDALCLMAPVVDGFAVSSLFEALLSRRVIGNKGTVHFTSPGLRPNELDALGELCDYISFNSLSQFDMFGVAICGKARIGVRVNPQLSFVEDDRYNPCRKNSKLGVPLDQLVHIMQFNRSRIERIAGVHIHTNCDSPDFQELLATVRHIYVHLEGLLEQVEWINLGGGYLFNEARDTDAFHEALDLLRSKKEVELFIEPGASIVRGAGYLVSTVVDVFASDDKMIAVLDTTVNHMPEVFEYQFTPDVLGHIEHGPYRYILAGCTCLSGDLFGEYGFKEPLGVGSRVIFSDAGAYTLVKAHMFNGVNLPTIYALKETGELVLKKRFTYNDFEARCGVDARVTV